MPSSSIHIAGRGTRRRERDVLATRIRVVVIARARCTVPTRPSRTVSGTAPCRQPNANSPITSAFSTPSMAWRSFRPPRRPRSSRTCRPRASSESAPTWLQADAEHHAVDDGDPCMRKSSIAANADHREQDRAHHGRAPCTASARWRAAIDRDGEVGAHRRRHAHALLAFERRDRISSSAEPTARDLARWPPRAHRARSRRSSRSPRRSRGPRRRAEPVRHSRFAMMMTSSEPTIARWRFAGGAIGKRTSARPRRTWARCS